MKILLIQARNAGDPMLDHELECFAERCELPVDAFRTLNLPTDTWSPDSLLLDIDAVMIGGSGDYSLAAGGFEWHDRLLELVRQIVETRTPMFASCFGFQAIVQAYGGEIVKDPAAAEVGTFEIRLTEAGQAHLLFADAPPLFDAQLGHNDSATAALPNNLINLACSERAPVQAIAVQGAPVIATQFHPELSMEANEVRYLRYLHAYNPEMSDERARLESARIHRPSPVAADLLRRFVDLYLHS